MMHSLYCRQTFPDIHLPRSAESGVFFWTISGQISHANAAFFRLIGYLPTDFPSSGPAWNEIAPPGAPLLDADTLNVLCSGRVAGPYLKTFVNKSGRQVRLLVSSAFLSGSDQEGISFVTAPRRYRPLYPGPDAGDQNYRVAVEAAADAIVTIDEQGLVIYANPAVERIFGIHPAELSGRPLDCLLPGILTHLDPDSGKFAASSWKNGEMRGQHRDGHEILLEVTVGEHDGGGHHTFTGVMRDITRRKKTEMLGSGQNKVLELIACSAPLAEILEDLVLLIEAQCEGMLGSILLLDEDGEHIRSGAAPHLPVAYSALLDHEQIGPQGGSCGTAMYLNKPVIVTDILADPLWKDYRAAASQFGLRACWATPILSAQGMVLGSFAMYYKEVRSPRPEELRLAGLASHLAGIAIERKRTEDYIRHQAHHDALTGLPNRVLLQTSLGFALAQARRQKGLVAVLFVDLDNFKTINDSLGHHVGDLLLKAVAGRLSDCLREEDQVARLGGDEFMIILPSLVHDSEAALVATKVLAALDLSFFVDGHELHSGASVGISLFPNDGETVESLMRAADTAMYHAKERGRGNFQFFTQDLNVAIQHRLATESQLRRALVRGELILHYQPQVEIASRRIFGAEALIRWCHPVRGLVHPSEFISIAEDSGLILQIGEWALREACMQQQRWRASGLPNLKMAVNMSTRQIFQFDLIEKIARILAQTGIPPNLLNLEITESILMQPNEENLMTLHKLNAMGIQLSVDDFGTGYSSLSYLRRFPIQTLKIDQSFVDGIDQDQNDMTITEAIIAMARSLRLNVIAEGVETAAQASFLAACGCGAAQGYYYARPLPADDFAALI